MKTILTVKEYNAKSISYHMKFQSNSGSLLKSGFVVTEDGNAKYFKTEKEAQQFADNGKFTERVNDVLPSEREYDWGIDMAYRLTGSGTEHISITK